MLAIFFVVNLTSLYHLALFHCSGNYICIKCDITYHKAFFDQLALDVPGANFTNRLKLSQLSLCIRLKPKNRLKSVREIGPCAQEPVQITQELRGIIRALGYGNKLWPREETK